ncbi:MAG TPA: DUF3761 domain-containing protein [Edaphobacter sp.]|nr:DUF3761 domain-containing protein [Edaphobacter sp.]
MKRVSLPLSLLAVALFAVTSAHSQTAAPPAGATGLCKDGTYTTAASKSGACRGHQGVKEWMAASTAPAAPAASTKAASTKAASAPASAAPAAKAAMPAPATSSAAAPAGATGLCKDGTYTIAASKSGACRGHQGVKEWMAASNTTAPAASTKAAPAPAPAAAATKAAMPAPTPAPAAPMSAAPAPAAAPKASQRTTMATAAPGGGPGLVWLNSDSNVYHCTGSQYYGKTKQGSYMSEADAKAKGAHADHNHPCTK